MPRYEFPNGVSFDGDELFDRPGSFVVYLTSVDSFYLFETGPQNDPVTGVGTNSLNTHSFNEFEKLAHWLNDDEMDQAKVRLEELRLERGDAA